MRAAAIKMRTYASTISDSREGRRQVLHFLFVFLGALALTYVVLLGSTVLNIIERRTLETEARALGNEVGEMELTYLSVLNKIDPALSQTLGFKEVKAKFVNRKSFEHLTAESGILKVIQNEI
ncbi:hypothetical protein A2933_02285 [Candidatus Nomurabacteria bacterium RIFCSPLOWO2_01_FULL_46_18]|uniref:Cell division protein FtsL n=1 Tax=Candidatus Nomurabacteria bacterium RIFCSPLOWO2_01_FULL_46_18 TaxID=1801783 RepID=A0A1F6XE40_9BACT|nr:MAG: hypothetical protein A2933_02285 [Candidatus Nomurabacteria bacterium RIFCSPLOWO2_01_FULL_46_18]